MKYLLLSSVLPGGRRGGAAGEHQGLRISAGCRLRELHPRVRIRGLEVSLPLQPGERQHSDGELQSRVGDRYHYALLRGALRSDCRDQRRAVCDAL